MPRPPSAPRVPDADAELWESYRLHQRDLLVACFEDAELMMRRTMVDATAEDRRLIVSLLWDKRCQPWKFYRDEMRAQRAMDLRQGRTVAPKAEA